ncbi:MAG: universal stress protein, partial [Anaerolineaceae bacterium]|nr:universal stress protein [Anaerolineaceae bacterium]
MSPRRLGKNNFKNLLLPVLPGVDTPAAWGLAHAIGGQVNLVGLLSVPTDEPISAVASKASVFRSTTLAKGRKVFSRPQMSVLVGHDLVEKLQAYVAENPHDLLIFEWPTHFEVLRFHLAGLLKYPNCNIAVVRGPWEDKISRILLPVRDGPYAEMALRLGRILPHDELYVVNFSPVESFDSIDPLVSGLKRVLPKLPDVTYKIHKFLDPLEGIIKESKHADLVVMGVSALPVEDQGLIGTISEGILMASLCPVIAVMTRDEVSVARLGEKEQVRGTRAISLLVDHWFAENT